MVTHAKVNSALSKFLSNDGLLFLIGSARQDSEFSGLVGDGKAILIARRTGWLKDKESITVSDSIYFKRKFAVFAKNFKHPKTHKEAIQHP